MLSLRKLNKNIPYIINVIDNGSDIRLRDRLIEFAEHKIIDNLFILNKNYGISFACNLGWKIEDAKYFAKIDNDVIIKDQNFLIDIVNIYKNIERNSTLGPEPEIYGRGVELLKTPCGLIGICTSNLPGFALIIPKKVSDVVGYFNEDYGVYGAEDGDYGFRMNFIGFRQYFFESSRFLSHEGKKDSSEYINFRLDKEKEHMALFKAKDEDGGGIGLLSLNACLYELCIRNWNVPLRYKYQMKDKYFVQVKERKEYLYIREALQKSKSIFDSNLKNFNGRIKNSDLNFSNDTITELKDIWKKCGQECKVNA